MKISNVAPRNQQVEKAAKMYEEHFLTELTKAMRKTIQRSDLVPQGMAERIYQDKMYSEYVEKWVQGGGVGLADQIYDHMMDKISPQMRPKGPFPINDKFKFNIEEGAEVQTIKFKNTTRDQGPVVAPLPGKVTDMKSENGISTIGLQHKGGSLSQLAFPGTLGENLVGVAVHQGQRLGTFEKGLLAWEIRPGKA